MELLVKPEMLTSYIYGPMFGNAETVSFYCLVASLSQGRTAAAQCSLFTHKSVPVIFEPPCTCSKKSMWHHRKP